MMWRCVSESECQSLISVGCRRSGKHQFVPVELQKRCFLIGRPGCQSCDCQRSFINWASFLIGWIRCPSAGWVFSAQKVEQETFVRRSISILTVYNEGFETGLLIFYFPQHHHFYNIWHKHKHILLLSQSFHSFLHNISSSNCPSWSCKITD